MYPNITNPGTPDDLSSGVCEMSKMAQYPILLMLRPPRNDLYTRIIQANPENRLRLTYSFAIDYLKNGSNTIFLRQGMMIQLTDQNEFVIFNPLPAYVDLTKVYTVTPVLYTVGYVEEFCKVNKSYVDGITEARVCYVKEGLVILVPA